LPWQLPVYFAIFGIFHGHIFIQTYDEPSCFVVRQLHRRRQADCGYVKAKIFTPFYITIIIVKKPGSERSEAQKLQGKDGIGDGVRGRN